MSDGCHYSTKGFRRRVRKYIRIEPLCRIAAYSTKEKRRYSYMELKLIGEKRTMLVKINAELDHHIACRLRESVDAKIKGSNTKNVIFDFSRVSFMDSSGIGVIMGRYKITRILGGKVVIFGVKKQVRRIIEMSGIDKIIEITDTLDEAMRIIEGRR